MNFGRPARTVVTVEDKETHNPLLGATVSLVSRADTLRGTTVKEDFYRIMAVYRCDRIFRDSVDLEVTYVGYKPFKKRYETPVPGTDRGQNGGRRTVDRAGRGRRAAGRHGLPGRHDGLQRGAFKTMADDRFAELLKQLPGVEIKDNKIYAGGAGDQTGADRREKPLRLENLLRTHRPRSLGRPERAGLRDFSPEAKRLGDNTAEKEKVMDVETKSKRGYILGGNLEGTLGASLEKGLLGSA